MDFSLGSVGDFLRKAQGAKAKQREAINEHLEPFLDDPSTYAMPPAMAAALEDLYEQFGDEALKQVGMVAIGKWASTHQEMLEEHLANDGYAEAMLTMNDLSKITTALRILADIGSFGGDEDYRNALKKQINQAVLEQIEESGRSVEDIFNGGES
jgi:hypothetical protein